MMTSLSIQNTNRKARTTAETAVRGGGERQTVTTAGTLALLSSRLAVRIALLLRTTAEERDISFLLPVEVVDRCDMCRSQS